jgi:hypothetical protein
VAVCYLCLDGGADDAGQPLRRDCACRGTDAGFVHLACLAEFAAAKSKAWDGQDINEFRKPWVVCPGCHQEYQNEFRIDIATEFVLFVRQHYPRNTQMEVEALYLKLHALDNMFGRLQPIQVRETEDTATVLLSLIDRMEVDASPLPRRYSQMKADAYNDLGRIALIEGTEESARRAVVHFEQYLKVCEAIGNDHGIATAKKNIALTKSMYEDGNNNEELLKASQELYELRGAKYGEEHEYTILAGKNYAIALQNANRVEEARDLLTKLLATSKQIFGPHHNTTKEVASALKWINFITFISTILFVFILIGALAVVCQLAKKLIFHSGKFYTEIIAKFSIQCSKEKMRDEL